MIQTHRAPNEVAKHFYMKYGHDKAVDIISSQIKTEAQKQDAEFWLDVLYLIASYDGQDPNEDNQTLQSNLPLSENEVGRR